MPTVATNKVIRRKFISRFRDKRHIRGALLRDWFSFSTDLDGFTDEEKENGFNYLQHIGDIVFQDGDWVWNIHGKIVRHEHSADCDSVGNVPIVDSSSAKGRWVLGIAHPRGW